MFQGFNILNYLCLLDRKCLLHEISAIVQKLYMSPYVGLWYGTYFENINTLYKTNNDTFHLIMNYRWTNLDVHVQLLKAIHSLWKFEAIQSKGYLNAMICQNIVGHWIKRGGSFLEAIKRLGRSTILIIIVMPRKRINNHRDWISHWNIQTFNMSGMNLFIDSRKGYLPSYKRKTVTEAFEP